MPTPPDLLAIEADARTAWQRDPALRSEFGDSFERYLAFSKAEARGLVRICSRDRTLTSRLPAED